MAFLRKDGLVSHSRQLASAGSQIRYSLSDFLNHCSQPPCTLYQEEVLIELTDQRYPRTYVINETPGLYPLSRPGRH